MADRTDLAQRFDEQRPHLRAVAYRMLGSLAEADDAVQDAWLRASRAGAADVDNLRGWLTTIVARLCLDRLRTRASRREEAIDRLDVTVPDPVVTSPDVVDPEQEAIVAESVGLAMLIVLETLSPAERLAFVLHDTFALPFEQIAPIVGRNVEATRQLASRARRRVRGATASTEVPLKRQWELVDAFLAAAREGDFDALMRVLDPAIVARADAGSAVTPFGRSRRIDGAEAVARQAMSFARLAPGARRAIVNGSAGLVVFIEGRRYAVLAMSFGPDSIRELDILVDPERLAGLELGAVAPAG
ncbi:MAG TPA: sigma-70 family RNA polymerase sigma factor [Candidatus Limnocylindrales bacterium]|nr:sigma-70 family RNA polymerase sigma factor [Candidatus Limnocylindrales bacterium]